MEQMHTETKERLLEDSTPEEIVPNTEEDISDAQSLGMAHKDVEHGSKLNSHR